jgi:hypothetical protein
VGVLGETMGYVCSRRDMRKRTAVSKPIQDARCREQDPWKETYIEREKE